MRSIIQNVFAACMGSAVANVFIRHGSEAGLITCAAVVCAIGATIAIALGIPNHIRKDP